MEVDVILVDTDLDVFPVWMVLSHFFQLDFEVVIYFPSPVFFFGIWSPRQRGIVFGRHCD